MKRRPLRLRWGFQNLTGSTLSWRMRLTDVFMGCEANMATLRPQLQRLGFRWRYVNAGLVIAWRPDRFRFASSEFRQFHRSGQAEKWHGIRTPRRGLLIVNGDMLVAGEWVPARLGVTHVLDSWGERGQDRRKEIVEQTTLPVIRAWAAEDRDHLTLLAGDFNRGSWSGRIPCMSQIYSHGLDRMHASIPNTLTAGWGSVVLTRKVGVGPTRQHHGLKVHALIEPAETFTFEAPKETA